MNLKTSRKTWRDFVSRIQNTLIFLERYFSHVIDRKLESIIHLTVGTDSVQTQAHLFGIQLYLRFFFTSCVARIVGPQTFPMHADSATMYA